MKNTSMLEEPSDNVLYAEKISRYEGGYVNCVCPRLESLDDQEYY